MGLQHLRITFKDGETVYYNADLPDDWTTFNLKKAYEYSYNVNWRCKENPNYDLITDWSSGWNFFLDARRDYKKIVNMIEETGHYAKYQDSTEKYYRNEEYYEYAPGSGYTTNIQLKHNEIDRIETW